MTLLELLNKYNFRNARVDTEIVRIYYNDGCNDWFEIGVNDWCDDEDKMHRLKYFVKEEVLNRQVYKFYYNQHVMALCIELMPIIVEE